MAATVDEAKAREHRESMASRTWYDVDPRLSALLDILFGEDDENPDGTASMTMVSQGSIITGQVVSQAAYEESQAAFAEAASPELAEALRLRSKAWADVKPELKARKENESIPALRTFVHFSTASVISGSSRSELTDLRVDLKDVSAWSIGSVSQVQG